MPRIGSVSRRPGTSVLVALSTVALVLAVISRSPAPARAEDSQNVTIPEAVAQAAQTGQPVLATAETTETSSITANPNGTLTATIGAGPLQEPDSSSPTGWSPIDLALEHTDGTYAPAVSAADTSFSDGGDKILATLSDGSNTYTEGWGSSLPAPDVSGSTATYHDVLPNIDLVMTAQTSGFKQSFVVKAAPMHQLVLDVPLSLRGLSATVDDNGNLVVTDSQGNPVATSGTAVMYGATMDSAGEPTVSATVETQVVTSHGSPVFEITPDQAFFSAPGVTYPVTIDPSPNLDVTYDTYVRQNTPDTAYLTDDVLKVGTNDGSDVMRTLLQFPTLVPTLTSTTNAIDVSSATLKLYQVDANTCAATEVDLYNATSDWTSNDPVTWNTQPDPGDLYASASAAYGRQNCSSNWVSIASGGANGVTLADLVQAWADGKLSNDGVILKAASETSTDYWKKFRASEHGSNMPYLAVTYTVLPGISLSVGEGLPGTQLTVSGSSFAANEQVTIASSDPVTTLATVTSSATGAFSASVTIPANAPMDDQQTITATGASQDMASTAFTTSNQAALDAAADDATQAAGSYLTEVAVDNDANVVRVYLASAPQATINSIVALHPDTYVITNTAAHSRAPLLSIEDQISSEITTLGPSGIYVRHMWPLETGTLEVGVTSSVSAAQSEFDSEFGTGWVTVVADTSPAIPYSYTRTAYRYNDFAGWNGGDFIYHEDVQGFGSNCTSGFPLHSTQGQHTEYMLTAAHCFWDYTGKDVHNGYVRADNGQVYGSGNLIGNVSLSDGRGSTDKNLDVALITVNTSTLNFSGAWSSSAKVKQTGFEYNHIGDYVRTSGAFEGEIRHIKIQELDVELCFGPDGLPPCSEHLAQAAVAVGHKAAGEGDSGGPVYQWYKDIVKVRGMIDAGSTEMDCGDGPPGSSGTPPRKCGSIVYFTEISWIMSTWHVAPNTQ